MDADDHKEIRQEIFRLRQKELIMHADKRKSSERRIFELRAEIETQLRYGNTVDALERLDAIQQIEKFSRPSKPTRGKNGHTANGRSNHESF
ncbi:MAG: hypothetical protein WAO35_22640 [Terriglobia bacterium]